VSHKTRLPGGCVALLLALGGIALVAGGARLVSVGGSWYYLLAGAVLLIDAWLLWREDPSSLWLFAALLIATLSWALWESGLDWWPLAARLDVLFIFSVLLLVLSDFAYEGSGPSRRSSH
jgi:quinoprotein glucose dehydrogenase